MNNSKNEHYKVSVLDYNLELIHIWNERHPKDLDPESTIADLDVLHQKGWRHK
jgi:hypothetical protein